MSEKSDYLCECTGSCDRRIKLSAFEANEIYDHKDWAKGPWIIANDCPVGLGPDFALLEKRDTYSLYKTVG